MATPAPHPTSRTTHDAFDTGEHDAHWELMPGDRLGSSDRTVSGTIIFWIAMLIACAGGWAIFSNADALRQWLPDELPGWSATNDTRPPVPAAPTSATTASQPAPTIAEPTTKLTILDQPSASQDPTAQQLGAPSSGTRGPAALPITTNALPPAVSTSNGRTAVLLQAPSTDPSDPYQKRAIAVGLHPDLSRAVLARLSSADYRNAGIAIQTALAETPDNAAFIWPQKPKPELALFQVRFVEGAAPSCRRYVVSIKKDGWLTTALPMENCDKRPFQTHRK
jgi:hypothetical protein